MNTLPLETIGPLLVAMLMAATPLLLAALGELVTERAGVLNLGVEGMMLMGAVGGFAAEVASGSPSLGILAAALAGMAMALLFAILTLSLLANQVATGLALTLFGSGLSALLGQGYVGTPLPRLPQLALPGLSDLPFWGPLLFAHDALVYLGLLLVPALSWFLYHSYTGLRIRAVGDSHDAAHAIGHPVLRIRYAAVLFGGALSGLAGGYLALAYTPMWAVNMTAGRGWIALALVVFAAWQPLRVLLGAWLFGGLTIAQLHVQGLGLPIAAQALSALPYLATILVLVLISRDTTRIRLNAPAALGKTFHPDD